MTIWKKDFNLEGLNKMSGGNMLELLDIQFTHFDRNSITASMPVDHRTHQPMGILHGGASVTLAESVGSTAANLCVDDAHYCVGLDINTNHISSRRSGTVFGTARAFHRGRSTQVWEIQIKDENNKLVAISRITMAVLKRPADSLDKTRITGISQD